MRSDTELRSEKRMDLLVLSDFAISDWIKSDLRIR